MRADGDDLGDLRLRQGFQILFGELLEHQIVAQAARRIAGAFLFLEDAESGSQVRHHARKRSDDLAALRIVGAHAAEPQAVFLSAVEDRELLLLNEFVALGRAEAERVAVAFERQKKLGAVLVLPLAGVHRAAAQADDDGHVLDADGALEFAGSAGGALKYRFLRKMLAEQRLFGGGAEFVQIVRERRARFSWGRELCRCLRRGNVRVQRPHSTQE